MKKKLERREENAVAEEIKEGNHVEGDEEGDLKITHLQSASAVL